MTDDVHTDVVAHNAHDDHHDDHGGHMSPAEQLENSKFAMWLYIGSEIMIFSGILIGYLPTA
jgi:heme/copper-type cytochrome/quinol oxidase subunit 3